MTLRDKLKFWILLSNYIQIVVNGTSPLSLPDAYTDAEEALQYLKAYGGSETRNVPEGYQELEYIEGNSANQYINTGIIPTSAMSYYVKVAALTQTSGSFGVFGARATTGGNDGIGFFIGSGANTRIDSFFFTANGIEYRWQLNNVNTSGDIYEATFKNSLQEIIKNGTSIGTKQYTPTTTCGLAMWLGSLNNAGSQQAGEWTYRLYRFKVENICDMIPARRLADGSIGMWDKIRKQFYTNAGTGSFIAGADVITLPEGYTRTAYTVMPADSYLLTDLVPRSSGRIELEVMPTTIAAAPTNWIGGRDSSTSGTGITFGHSTSGAMSMAWFTDGGQWSIGSNVAQNSKYLIVCNNGNAELFIDGVSTATHTFTINSNNATPLALNGINIGGTITVAADDSRFYGFRVWSNSTLIANYIPCRQNTIAGFYDTVSGTFKGATAGTFTAGPDVAVPSPDRPLDIWCNNGAVKVIRPLEYLQSTGTQYIDTGFIPNGHNIKVKTKLEVIGTTNSDVFFGEYKVNEQIRSHPFNGNYFFGYATGSNNTIAGNPTVAVKAGDIIEYDWTNNTVKFNCNGTDYNYTLPGTVITSDLSIWLFSLNTGNGQNDYTTNAKMYYFQIYDNDVLVRDMIPALDANNVPCMYDKVEGKCYYNAGTGQFIAPYLPAEYERLEYIQGYTGNSSVDPNIKAAYIDTGLVFDTTVNMYYKGGIGGFNTNSVLAFGARPSNAYSGLSSYFSGSDVVTDWGGVDASGRWTLTLALIAGDTFEVSTSNKTMTISKNGTVAGTHTFTGTATNNLTFYLNSRHDLGGAPSQSSPSIGRLYRFTVAGVCDMIPARKRSNGHIGMYDLVRRQFFESAGEGQFTMGKLPILPDGYTQLEYLESTGTQYIDTGVIPNQDTSVELDGSIDGYGIFFGVRTAALVDISTIQGTSTGYWAMGYNTSADAFGIKDSNRHVWFKNKNLQYMDGALKNNYTYANFTAMGNAYLFAYNNNGAVGYVINGTVRIYSCKIWATADSMLVRHLIPAKRNSDSVVGMYDIMNDVFLTNQGTGEFVYGSEIPDSRELYYYVDGIVEKVGTHSASNKNLFNGAFEQGGIFQGNRVNANTRIRTPNPFSLSAGTYTISCASAYEIWVEINNASGVSWESSKTITVSATDKIMIAVRNKIDPSTTLITPDEAVNVQIEAGSTATAYSPYYDGGLAVCQDLFGLPDYLDEQEILGGDITRKVGVCVLTGEEWWEKLTFAGKSVFRAKVVIPDDRYSNPENNVGLCSHFTVIPTSASVTSLMNNLELAWNTNSLMCIRYDSMSTLNDFLAFLRSQYNAGTPVTIVYPLATASTETVAGQTLTVAEGDNTAEIQQASIDGLTLEAKYIKVG